jgi:preprotein translocase subunit YajC
MKKSKLLFIALALLVLSVACMPMPGEDGEPGPMGGEMFSMLFFLGMMFVVFYFFLIRPESKRKKKAAKMRNELIVGDIVTTSGGIIGRVVNIKDDEITVETGSDKVRIKFARWAISSKQELISE